MSSSLRKSLIALPLLAILATVITTGCSDARPPYRKSEGGVWTTTYHITYSSPHILDDSIIAVINRVDASLSPFNPQSVISAINSGQSNRTDSLVRRIFTASQLFNAKSHGMFDPTVAPIVNLWGFGYRHTDTEPTAASIDSALAHVGIARCRLSGDSLIKATPQTEFNFSAIAKGYACDLIGEMLRRNGCQDYMVEIGGEIAVSGKNPRGQEWRVMIDAPIENDTTVTHSRLAVIPVSNAGVATSGNYRNFRRTASGKVWHTIDPTTGYPAHTSTLSATVVAPDALTADALATACMSMPPQQALEMIESMPGVAVLLTSADGDSYTITASSRFPEIMR